MSFRDSAETYHWRESPTQTKEDAVRQVQSEEIWGKAGRIGGLVPAVKAYRGPLPKGQRGIEFTTVVDPDAQSSSPFEVRWNWYTPGVIHRQGDDGVDYAVIPARVVNKQP